MKLIQARVQNYRSIRDTGWFDVEEAKTILVGPNEAGKTAILEAMQQINPPDGVKGFDGLRDYPRKLYNANIQLGKQDPGEIPVASAKFALEAEELAGLPDSFSEAGFCYTRYLDNELEGEIIGGPEPAVFTEEIRKDLQRLASHVDGRVVEGGVANTPTHSARLDGITSDWSVGTTAIEGAKATSLREWLDSVTTLVDEDDEREDARHTRLLELTRIPEEVAAAVDEIQSRLPVFVYYSNYFRVRPNLHLRRFADRLERNVLDDDRYDYGNKCLLKLLGFEARELANLGDAHAEADTVLIQADGQYLKVVVQDELGVLIELDQRSAGFQWLVSFFVVFFAEAQDAHRNAILLLDEPGLSLHGLKQREFRQTISRLAEGNQTLYTTHSPFLVGPDELDWCESSK